MFESGKIYKVTHQRKGTFVMRVDSQDDEWAHGEVVSGETSAMLDYNVKGEGDSVSVRKSLVRSVEEQGNV